MSDCQSTRVLYPAFWTLSLLVVALSSMAEQGLYADGVAYLLSSIERGGFGWNEPSRIVAHYMMKFPVALFIKAGVSDPHVLARVYTVTMSGLPLLFLAAGYRFIPRDRKGLFAIPVMVYLTGFSASSFYLLGEAQLAAAWFWFLVLMVRYVKVDSWASRAGVLLVAVPAFLMHQVFLFLGLILVAMCVFRARRESTRSSAWFWYLMAGTYLIVVLVNGYNTVYFRDMANASEFSQNMMKLRFYIDGISTKPVEHWMYNGPAILGLIALAVSAFLVMIRRHSAMRYVAIGVFSVVSLIYVLDVFFWYRGFWPHMHYISRSYAALISIPAVLLFLKVSFSGQESLDHSMSVLTPMILVLLLAQTVWNIGAIGHWKNYISVIRDDVSRHHGIIPYDESLVARSEIFRMPVQRMVFPWTLPLLSTYMAPYGNVQSIIDVPEDTTWTPWDIHQPATIPRLNGFHFDRFFDAVKKESAAQ